MPRGNLKNFGTKQAPAFKAKPQGPARPVVPGVKGTGTRVAGAKTTTRTNALGARVTSRVPQKGVKR
jgi:hypothetical protein